MSRTRVPLSVIAVALLNLLHTAVSFPEDRLNAPTEVDAGRLELLQAEVLDTVALDRAVHFTAPDLTDTVAGPETYQVAPAGGDRLKLVAVKSGHALMVEALSTNHSEDITTPIALYVQDDEKFPHVVLLLPNGKCLEAVGSYDVARSRGVRTFQLTLIQIQHALKKKLQKKSNE